MANGFQNIRKGLNTQPVAGTTVTVAGDIAYNLTAGKLEMFHTVADSFVMETKAATLSNKTFASPTVTGTLSGVTATFTGLVSMATDSLVTGAAAAGFRQFIVENTSTTGFVRTLYEVGSAGGSGTAHISYAPSSGGMSIGTIANDTTSPIVFVNNNNTTRLTIAANGLVTVAQGLTVGGVTTLNSSVGITGTTTINGDANTGGAPQNAQLQILGVSSTTKRLSIGYNTSSNYGMLSAETSAGVYSDIYICPNGGNVKFGVSNNIIGSDGTANAAAGNIGEVIQSTVGSGSAVTLTTATTANLTSIALTPGDWMLTLQACFNGTVTGTAYDYGISATSATITAVFGDGTLESNVSPTAAADASYVLSNYKIRITANTTYYGVVKGVFTVGTLKAYGRLTAVRIR